MKQLLLLAVILSLSACVGNKYLTSSTTMPTEVANIGYFPPFSYIRYIEKGNKALPSDSLSEITSNNMSMLLEKNRDALRLDREIVIFDDMVRKDIEGELEYLASLIYQQKKLSGIPLPRAIKSVLENNNQRFSLALIATGFGRRKGNYGGQIAKGVAVGLLTMGMFVPTPVKSNLTLHAFIFDLEKDEITYYKRSIPIEKEPTDGVAMEKLLIKLFEKYFYDKR